MPSYVQLVNPHPDYVSPIRNLAVQDHEPLPGPLYDHVYQPATAIDILVHGDGVIEEMRAEWEPRAEMEPGTTLVRVGDILDAASVPATALAAAGYVLVAVEVP